MNEYQKEVEKQLLDNEEQVLEELKNNYIEALKDVKASIKELTSDEMTQSKIYQKQYQENLERQLQANIDLLSTRNFKSISEYLKESYQDGFIGTLYNMQNEGVPFIMPLNQETIVKSILKRTEDFKLSKTLYKNAEELKKTIKSQITRGVSKASSYAEIARIISKASEADLKKSYRIARTEGGRVATEAKFEAMQRAKVNGADVVKEWDSTMDKRTRETHIKLDGQIKEIEELFEIDGKQALYPHGFGIAEEDINCRCALLQRARWAVEDDGAFTKVVDGDIVEFENVKCYQEYKEKYFDFYKKSSIIEKVTESDIIKQLQKAKIDYNKVKHLSKQLSTEEIIAKISGGDMTKGSCSSVAFAYIGNRNGLDVLDFRGGESQNYFSTIGNIYQISQMPGVKSIVDENFNDIMATMNLLKNTEIGKEYYIATGNHAAIVRKVERGHEYLELQSPKENGFKPLTMDALKKRFGCKQSHSVQGYKLKIKNILIDVDSLKDNSEFEEILGYLNTSGTKQIKGEKRK